MRNLLTKLQMDDDKIMMRMTGCPNGCGKSVIYLDIDFLVIILCLS